MNMLPCSQSDFERWSRCLRAAIDTLGEAAKADVRTTQALEAATNAGDLFRAAMASPKERPHRRAGGSSSLLHSRGGDVAVGSGSGCSVRLLLLAAAVLEGLNNPPASPHSSPSSCLTGPSHQ